MNNSEKHCLKWNDYESDIRNSFRGLRKDQEYFDVTLASGDGHRIEAHKIVLSAGSRFFSDIFRKTKHPCPFIYLKGTNGKELGYVVDFIYNGEVNVAHEELDSFLETAQELDVKGLKTIQEEKETNNVQSRIEETDNLNSFHNVENNQSDLDSDQCNSIEEVIIKSEDNASNELEVQIKNMIHKKGGLWECLVCEKIAKTKHNIKNHAETHIEGVLHKCHICNKRSSTRSALATHLNDFHSQLTFDCNVCLKVGMTKMTFKIHKRNCRDKLIDKYRMYTH